MFHIDIKAEQSETWRKYRDERLGRKTTSSKKKRQGAPAPEGDPLHALLGKAPTAPAPTTQEPQAETQEQPKEEPAPETPEQQQTREEVTTLLDKIGDHQSEWIAPKTFDQLQQEYAIEKAQDQVHVQVQAQEAREADLGPVVD